MDMTDVYAFPGSTADRIVLVLNSWAFLTPAQTPSASFDPNILYQFKIDNTGDAKEDRVIQVTFNGTGPTQTVEVRGPMAPPVVGAMMNTIADVAPAVTGAINQVIGTASGMQVFAGAREDPFFLDLEQFFRILPDRKPTTGSLSLIPDTQSATSFRAAGSAVDALEQQPALHRHRASHGAAHRGWHAEARPLGHDQPLIGSAATSLHHSHQEESLHVERFFDRCGAPRCGRAAALALSPAACGDATTTPRHRHRRRTRTYNQVQRLGNPLVSEVLLAKRDHAFHGSSNPSDDVANFSAKVKGFVAAFRPNATGLQNALAATLLPDVLIVQTDKAPTTAGWLSWALATGNGYGGRKLTDDVVDISLTAVFSDLLDPTQFVCKPFTLPLCTDNVGSHGGFTTTFPYLGPAK